MATLENFLSTVADKPDDFRVLYELRSLRALHKRIQELEAGIKRSMEVPAFGAENYGKNTLVLLASDVHFELEQALGGDDVDLETQLP